MHQIDIKTYSIASHSSVLKRQAQGCLNSASHNGPRTFGP